MHAICKKKNRGDSGHAAASQWSLIRLALIFSTLSGAQVRPSARRAVSIRAGGLISKRWADLVGKFGVVLDESAARFRAQGRKAEGRRPRQRSPKGRSENTFKTPTRGSPVTAPRDCGDAAKSARRFKEGEDFLAVHGVEKSFGSRKVVKGVSLAVRGGEAVGLLGPNGAGKTTVFYMITGLIAADRGRIELDGHDVTKLPMYQRARLGIGYLPQEASIFRGLNVEENIRAHAQKPSNQTAASGSKRTRCAAGRVQHHAAAQDAVDRAIGRRATAC